MKQKKHEIILVDDDDLLRKSIALVLKTEGYKIQVASALNEGQKLLQSRAKSLKSCILVTDWNLDQGEDASVLLTYLNGRAIAGVVLMSGNPTLDLLSAPHLTALTNQNTAFRLLEKPFRLSLLLTTLEEFANLETQK